MSAQIVPFPIVRRHGFIARQAEYASHMNPDGRRRYLGHQFRLQADAMRRKGISEDLVQRELRSMTAALHVFFTGARRAT
jgi:hypothetical protein